MAAAARARLREVDAEADGRRDRLPVAGCWNEAGAADALERCRREGLVPFEDPDVVHVARDADTHSEHDRCVALGAHGVRRDDRRQKARSNDGGRLGAGRIITRLRLVRMNGTRSRNTGKEEQQGQRTTRAGNPTNHARDSTLFIGAPPRRTATPLRVVSRRCRPGPRAQAMQRPRHEDRRGAARRTDCMRLRPNTPSADGARRIGGGGRESGCTRRCPHGSASSEAARAGRVGDQPRTCADPAGRISGSRVAPSASGGRRRGRRGPCTRRAGPCPGPKCPGASSFLHAEPITMSTRTPRMSIEGVHTARPLPSHLHGRPNHRRTR